MSKGVITDPTISIRPSKKLIDFITNLNDPKVELPENLLKVYQVLTGDKSERKIFKEEISSPTLSNDEKKFLSELRSKSSAEELKTCLEGISLETEENEEPADEVETITNDTKNGKNQAKRERAKQKEMEKSKLGLNLNDLKWLNNYLKEQRTSSDSAVYLHELIEGSKIVLPKNEILERNPELEARCKRLRREQEEREYQSMTKNVDCNRTKAPDESIAYQMKQINSQLIAILQFIFSVLAGFAFGFIGVELIIGNLDFGFRLLLGVICALIIALAEIYFLAKKLNEDFDFEETMKDPMKSKEFFKQNINKPSSNSGKEHVD